MDVARLHDVGAVDPRVQDAHLAERVNHRAREERHETEVDAVPGLETLAVPRAQRLQLTEVDLVERGEDGRGALRLDQACGDRAAELAHRPPLGVLVARGGGRPPAARPPRGPPPPRVPPAPPLAAARRRPPRAAPTRAPARAR